MAAVQSRRGRVRTPMRGGVGAMAGAIVLSDAPAAYVNPGLSYTRSGAIYVPQQDGTLATVPSDTVPREWDGGRWVHRMDPGWTQSLLKTHNFGNGNWVKSNADIAAQGAQGPNAADAWPMVENTAAAISHYIRQACSFVAGTSYCMTAVIAPRTGNRFVQLTFTSVAFGSNAIACFNPDTGEWTKNATATGAGSYRMANGNWLIWMAATATATVADTAHIRLNTTFSTTLDTWTGDGVSGVNLWCANVTNTAYPVPLTSANNAAVTIGNAAWLGTLAVIGAALPGDFTLAADYTLANNAPAASRHVLRVDDNAESNRALFYAPSTTSNAGMLVSRASAAQYAITSAMAFGVRTKVAMRVGSATANAALNGVLLGSAANQLPNGLTHARIGSSISSLQAPVGLIGTAIYPTALTDAQLAQLTQ